MLTLKMEKKIHTILFTDGAKSVFLCLKKLLIVTMFEYASLYGKSILTLCQTAISLHCFCTISANNNTVKKANNIFIMKRV